MIHERRITPLDVCGMAWRCAVVLRGSIVQRITSSTVWAVCVTSWLPWSHGLCTRGYSSHCHHTRPTSTEPIVLLSPWTTPARVISASATCWWRCWCYVWYLLSYYHCDVCTGCTFQ